MLYLLIFWIDEHLKCLRRNKTCTGHRCRRVSSGSIVSTTVFSTALVIIMTLVTVTVFVPVIVSTRIVVFVASYVAALTSNHRHAVAYTRRFLQSLTYVGFGSWMTIRSRSLRRWASFPLSDLGDGCAVVRGRLLSTIDSIVVTCTIVVVYTTSAMVEITVSETGVVVNSSMVERLLSITGVNNPDDICARYDGGIWCYNERFCHLFGWCCCCVYYM